MAQGSWQRRHAAVCDLSVCRAPGLEQKHYFRTCPGIGFHCHPGICCDLGVPHRVRPAAVKTLAATCRSFNMCAPSVSLAPGEEIAAACAQTFFPTSSSNRCEFRIYFKLDMKLQIEQKSRNTLRGSTDLFWVWPFYGWSHLCCFCPLRYRISATRREPKNDRTRKDAHHQLYARLKHQATASDAFLSLHHAPCTSHESLLIYFLLHMKEGRGRLARRARGIRAEK